MNNSDFGKTMRNVRKPRIYLDFERSGSVYSRRQIIRVMKFQI